MLKELKNLKLLTFLKIFSSLAHYSTSILYALSINFIIQSLSLTSREFVLNSLLSLGIVSLVQALMLHVKNTVDALFYEGSFRKISLKIMKFYLSSTLKEYEQISHTAKLSILTRQIIEVVYGLNSFLNGVILLFRLILFIAFIGYMLPLSLSYVLPLFLIMMLTPSIFGRKYQLIGQQFLEKNRRHNLLHQNVLEYVNFLKKHGAGNKLFELYKTHRKETLKIATSFVKHSAIIGFVTNFGTGIAHATAISITVVLSYYEYFSVLVLPSFGVFSFSLFASTTELLQISFIGFMATRKTYQNIFVKYYKKTPLKPFQWANFEQLTLNNITIKYNSKTIFKNFNLEVQKGEKILLTGPSGIGKSSLLKLLLGLIDFQGKLQVNNTSVEENHKKEMLYKLCFFTSSNTPFFSGSLLENLTFGEKKLETQATLLLKTFFASPPNSQLKISDKQHPFSMGEQQILGIIRALLSEKPLLLFDEAVANIDQKSTLKVIKEVINSSKTIIFVSHTLKDSACQLFDQHIKLGEKNVKSFR